MDLFERVIHDFVLEVFTEAAAAAHRIDAQKDIGSRSVSDPDRRTEHLSWVASDTSEAPSRAAPPPLGPTDGAGPTYSAYGQGSLSHDSSLSAILTHVLREAAQECLVRFYVACCSSEKGEPQTTPSPPRRDRLRTASGSSRTSRGREQSRSPILYASDSPSTAGSWLSPGGSISED